MIKKKQPGERIAKVIARAGVASRRESERLILSGYVTVNRLRINSPALNVSSSDTITVKGKLLGEQQPSRLWYYNKPSGLVTTNSDEKGRESIYDKLPKYLPRVMSIGRLDLTSEGLLLLTNDGELKRKMELPSSGFIRKYRIRAKGVVNEEGFDLIRKGIIIKGEKFRPIDIRVDKIQGANIWLTAGLSEGKNRELRRVLEQVGLLVNRLIRTSYGPFQLGFLPRGGIKEVKRKTLHEQVGNLLKIKR